MNLEHREIAVESGTSRGAPSSILLWGTLAAAFSRAVAHWAFKPDVLLMIPYLFFLLEPVRGGFLCYLSRRY
jgi:hypothetical protein